jgi:hypothetical protein
MSRLKFEIVNSKNTNHKYYRFIQLLCMKSQGGKEYPTYNRAKEGQLDWSHLVYEAPAETCYSKKDTWKYRSDTKTRKKI